MVKAIHREIDRGDDRIMRDEIPLRGDDGSRVREVPIEVSVNRGVVEAFEGAVERTDLPPEVAPKLARPAPRAGERRTWDPCDRPHEVVLSRRRRHAGHQ